MAIAGTAQSHQGAARRHQEDRDKFYMQTASLK